MPTNASYFTDPPPGDPSTYAPRYAPRGTEWIPRWFAAWDVPATIDRPTDLGDSGNAGFYSGWYRTQFSTPGDIIKRWAKAHSRAGFFASLSAPRLAYVAPCGDRVPVLALATLGSGHVGGSISLRPTEGALREPWWAPAAWVDGRRIVLRNLAIVEAAVTASGGVLDIAGALASSPKVADSPVWVANLYGDVQCFDADYVEACAGRIPAAVPGGYKVRYESQPVYEAVVSSTCLTVDGTAVRPSPTDLRNVVDDLAAVCGLERVPGEDNGSLRKRCQVHCLAENPEQAMAAALGKADPVAWDTGYSLEVQDATPAFPGLEREARIEERLLEDGGRTYLTRTPLGPISLFSDGSLVSPSKYSVSGTEVTLSDPFAALGTLTARYRATIYSATQGASSTTLSASVPQTLQLGAVHSDVSVQTTFKTDIVYRWGQTAGANEGLAGFDGSSPEPAASDTHAYYKGA